jgi:pimeloyl-ACP methyl ester carboxylesterase
VRARSRTASLGALVAALASACILSIAAPTARAAEQWNDGGPAMSTQVKCVINLQETGAIAKAGYLADPSKLPKAGEVFYGHAVFGATTDTACSSGDQLAELDIVLPPGVSLAIDATHPITCLYADDDGPGANYPTCPTHTIVGGYGPSIPADDAGHAWTMPAGREFDVRFPLTSNRKLVGPGGGHCPQSLDEIPTSPQRDCLLIALHVVDGYSDPG